jgi:hypothetical protein
MNELSFYLFADYKRGFPLSDLLAVEIHEHLKQFERPEVTLWQKLMKLIPRRK